MAALEGLFRWLVGSQRRKFRFSSSPSSLSIHFLYFLLYLPSHLRPPPRLCPGVIICSCGSQDSVLQQPRGERREERGGWRGSKGRRTEGGGRARTEERKGGGREERGEGDGEVRRRGGGAGLISPSVNMIRWSEDTARSERTAGAACGSFYYFCWSLFIQLSL